MNTGKPVVLVAGDMAFDRLGWGTPSLSPSRAGDIPVPKQSLSPNYDMITRPGGVFLLAGLLRNAAGDPPRFHVVSYDIPEEGSPGAEGIVYSTAFLAEFPASPIDPSPVYRIASFAGYSSNPKQNPPTLSIKSPQIPDFLVVDDAGNYFRYDPSAWPEALTKGESSTTIVLKMNRPLCEGPLWKYLAGKNSDRLYVIVSGDDLRAHGAHISRQLSWEKTAEDFIWQIQNNPSLRELASCRHLIVRFGLDAAIYYSCGEKGISAELIYDPLLYEGGFREKIRGEMQGISDAFISGFTGELITGGRDAVRNAIMTGILSSRRLYQKGFGSPPGQPDYPTVDIFPVPHSLISSLSAIPIPLLPSPDRKRWTILESLPKAQMEQIARNIVIDGKDPFLSRVPVGTFGDLTTVDRNEIESYQSIRNLMVEYLKNPRPDRPLCIAVFGPPGSGKSFGVTQLAKSIGASSIEKLDFNLSQYSSPDDLIPAFHKIRDSVLRGKIPLVFFDEFDSPNLGTLGWLKYFLAPMQDGEFREGESTHPIGKGIFVFAGGICQTVREFSSNEKNPEGKFSEGEFQQAKGTDFTSRLRGYVEIRGCNPQSPADHLAIIRRSMLLRSLLKRKFPEIFSPDGMARIDRGVLRAFLKVPEFRHGVRSIEAILDMSRLSGRLLFEQAALPPPDQLDLHVNAGYFMKLVVQEVLFEGALENLAKAIHEEYLRTVASLGPPHSQGPAAVPWGDLPEEYRQSNRDQARHILSKLEEMGFGFVPSHGTNEPLLEFTPEEIEEMARMEHIRWMEEKIRNGWIWGAERDNSRKVHPLLIPWEDLPYDEKVKDYNTVRKIPEYMRTAGFSLYRSKKI